LLGGLLDIDEEKEDNLLYTVLKELYNFSEISQGALVII